MLICFFLPFHPVELLACGVWLITIKQENFLRYIEILLPIMSNLDGLFCNFSTITVFFAPIRVLLTRVKTQV